ncbi:trehalose phosphate synthase [Actinidia rufa]|uniref:Trehalose phosphate synthase n=1 Tax=Actinidia rufa TaxID=165716 RepID=A0A7J0FQ83_9ERIC|nr:trehalose phosphate synthase [Actinidia rufa]
MESKSCANFFDLASGDLLNIPPTPRALPRVMTIPGIISYLDGDSDGASSVCHERKVIVANTLPLHAQRDVETAKWCFSWDEDSLLLQMKDGFSLETEFIYVGSLKVEVDASEQEEVAQKLLDNFNCVPTFLPHDLQEKFYHGFCKNQAMAPFPLHATCVLWPCRMLGLDYESKRGHIGLDYFGRTVYIKILPVGIHMGRLESVLNLPSTAIRFKEIQAQFQGKKLILGIDDMDIFKGQIILVQIVNPARSSGKDVQEAKRETYLTAERINQVHGSPGYEPVILIDRPVARYEKSAYYAAAECCIVNAVRDGMNLVPYKYIVCRQGSPDMDKAMGVKTDTPCTSMLVVSEFVGCSPSLSGAIRVNPWDIESVAEAMNLAITMPESEKHLRHEKHYRYWLAPCERLGIAAEHGCFMKWSKNTEWEFSLLTADLEWKEIVEPIMKLYTEATDGSNIEVKETALVWHHQDADPDFGSCQAKELLDHLENVLANEPAVVNRGQHIVEVKPQGVSKGLVAEKVISTMVNGGKPPDFVMCVGDDRSDEHMFESILSTVSCPSLRVAPDIFACTVGQKPSKAKYYLDDTADVVRLLRGLANASSPKPTRIAQFQVSIDNAF